MLLRKITQHVKDQNWFAVWLDFLIVVFGLFIGFQVQSWNEARTDRNHASAINKRLETEFTLITEDLASLSESLLQYRYSTLNILKALDKNESTVNRELMNVSLAETLNVGRPPSRSSTYIQLVSTGDIALLQNEKLRILLVKYDQSIEKNRLLYGEILAHHLRNGKMLNGVKVESISNTALPNAIGIILVLFIMV
mgnify:CR=1 FL=1